MAYIDHIRLCNDHDMANLALWRIDGRKAGYVGPELAKRLRDFPGVFDHDGREFTVNARLSTPQDRTSAVAEMLDRLRGDGLAGTFRDESYGVLDRVGGEAMMTIDRGAASPFGIISTGFHLNGTVGAGDSRAMWIARRSLTKTTFPGQLDNMVAGGQPAGLTLAENVVKECWEEANIPAALARHAVPAGLISYTMTSPDGLRRHAMYVYDLDCPADFTPHPLDGEVDSFALTPIREVAATVDAALDAFKFNCSLVVIDFLIRHGVITPDHPDYFDLIVGLRGRVR